MTAHAARGLIPGARQFGKKWTFDAAEIRACPRSRHIFISVKSFGNAGRHRAMVLDLVEDKVRRADGSGVLIGGAEQKALHDDEGTPGTARFVGLGRHRVSIREEREAHRQGARQDRPRQHRLLLFWETSAAPA